MSEARNPKPQTLIPNSKTKFVDAGSTLRVWGLIRLLV